ncbi:mechanosensitive ion channel family protein [Desulfosarcina sp.]|uniref:mechanosensitive ion channel family protein n=1 Tax=Desulfosarcina sp. TaxID=2027861 RepID=UPI003563A4C8
MQSMTAYLNLSPELVDKIALTLIVVLFLSLGRLLVNIIIKRRIADAMKAYRWRRTILYAYTLVLLVWVGSIWTKGIASLATFMGLASAGVAIAMHDTIANLAGWFFIIWRKPFKVGDRIEIGQIAGDVIDIRIFQFSMVEIGHWVDADQSTGRIVHVPNSKVLKEPLANYHIGFEYIWNEIQVRITFESAWKKAKRLLENIASANVEHLSTGAQEQIRQAAKKYFIFFTKFTPIVYTTVKDNGVLLTIRYLVNPRQRRSTEQQIWEATLDAFNQEKDIEFAYPTTRFYNREYEAGIFMGRAEARAADE